MVRRPGKNDPSTQSFRWPDGARDPHPVEKRGGQTKMMEPKDFQVVEPMPLKPVNRFFFWRVESEA